VPESVDNGLLSRTELPQEVIIKARGFHQSFRSLKLQQLAFWRETLVKFGAIQAITFGISFQLDLRAFVKLHQLFGFTTKITQHF